MIAGASCPLPASGARGRVHHIASPQSTMRMRRRAWGPFHLPASRQPPVASRHRRPCHDTRLLHHTPLSMPQPLPLTLTEGFLRGVLARHFVHLLVLLHDGVPALLFDRERLCWLRMGGWVPLHLDRYYSRPSALETATAPSRLHVPLARRVPESPCLSWKWK